MRRVTMVRTTSRAALRQWLSCAARIAHGGAVPDRMAAEMQLALARAVRPLAAGAPPVPLARGSGALSTAVLESHRCQMPPEGEYTNPNQMPWLTRRARTMALRRSAEPELLGSAGTGFARVGELGALGWQGTSQGRGAHEFVPSFTRANPSIERTNNGKPLFAAHVER
jgi:ferredoxin